MDNSIKYWFLCFLHLLLKVVDYLTDIVFGTTYTGGASRERIKAKNEYQHSAQVVTIRWRAKHHISSLTRLQNFLYKHEKYVNPDYIMKNKNVTLMAVEKEHALFAMSDPSVDVYDPKKHPFVFISQYQMAKKLLILPIRSFHRLAEELGDIKLPVAMMGMTARCGSTLLVQIFNKVPGTRVMSEPMATLNIHDLRARGIITPEESVKLLRSAIRLHCKVESGSGVERFFIKLTTRHTPQIRDIGKLFPHIKYFFNTRHPVPSLKSAKRGLKKLNLSLYVVLGIMWREEAAKNFTLTYDGKYEHLTKDWSKWLPNISRHAYMAMAYLSVVAYFDNKDLYDLVILYENLSKDPKNEIEKIFMTMEISSKHIPAALEALKQDSKSGNGYDRNKKYDTQLDKDVLMTFDYYMEMAGLPIRHNMTEQEFKSLFGK